jgi:hypothetical protein
MNSSGAHVTIAPLMYGASAVWPTISSVAWFSIARGNDERNVYSTHFVQQVPHA